MRTTRESGIRVARRMDEVGFSDIVQVRNKVMAMRAEGLTDQMGHARREPKRHGRMVMTVMVV